MCVCVCVCVCGVAEIPPTFYTVTGVVQGNILFFLLDTINYDYALDRCTL